MSLSESRPSFPNNVYKSGRGGAGNFHHLPATTNPATVASPATTVQPKPHAYFSGRGGAANYHSAAERTMFSFDEEIERERLIHAHHVAPVYSVGRGGAGNMVASSAAASSHRRGSAGSVQEEDAARRVSFGSDRSHNSLSSTADRIGQKLRQSISRH